MLIPTPALQASDIAIIVNDNDPLSRQIGDYYQKNAKFPQPDHSCPFCAASCVFNNRFLPGAVADHLTSAGGVMSGSSQMNILEWIKAGATGSYGAVVEPCNFPAKYPNPGILMLNYLRGSSLLDCILEKRCPTRAGDFRRRIFGKTIRLSSNRQAVTHRLLNETIY